MLEPLYLFQLLNQFQVIDIPKFQLEGVGEKNIHPSSYSSAVKIRQSLGYHMENQKQVALMQIFPAKDLRKTHSLPSPGNGVQNYAHGRG